MAVKKSYRINLKNYGSPPAIMVSQYDEGYAISFEIFDGPLPVLASSLSGYTFKLKGRQPGNPPFLAYEFEGTLATSLNASVSFEIDTTMTGRAGKGTAELVILDEENDVKFASVNFAVYTEPAAVPDGSIDADVQRAMEIAEEVQEIVDTAAETVRGEAEAWAVGQRDGQDVPSTDPAYENNAKFYAEQAAETAESIEGVTSQVATNTSDISSLKEDLNVVETGGYHSTQVTYEEGGYIKNYSPGDVAPYSGWKYTDYIDVSATKNGKIIVKQYTGAGVETLDGKTYNAWYDVNKNWIGVLTVANDAIEVPKGAVYVRLSCKSAYTHALSLFTNGVFDMVKNDTSDMNYIDILQWNVGIFKDGTHKPSTEESPAQIVSMKKTVGDLNPHIVNTQEYVDAVDDANTISSANIFSFKYSNKTHRYGNKCFSKFRIVNSETITFDSGSNRNCRAYDVEINNKVITIINVHLSIELNPSTYRTADIQQLINYMNAKKYVILTGDFNVSSDSEYDAFKSAGYVLCNGGDFGWFDTWPVMENMWDGFTPDWPCYHLDNIIVSSNITPQNVTKISCSVSDHAPLMATLRID